MFTEDEKLIIAQIYTQHKRDFDNPSRKPDRLERVNELYSKMTNAVNSMSSKEYTVAQIREQLKQLKSKSKEITVENRKSAKQPGGGENEQIAMSASETIMSSNFIGTPSYEGIPGGGIESGLSQNLHFHFRRPGDGGESFGPSSNLRDDALNTSDELSDDDSTGSHFNRVIHRPTQETRLPASVLDVTDAMSFFNASEPAATSAATSRPHPSTHVPPSKKPKLSAGDTIHSNRALQADVLQLQHEVYSGMKEMVSEVRGMSEDMRAMISEARLAIFEYRLTLRGANVANINVEPPPGIEEHLKR